MACAWREVVKWIFMSRNCSCCVVELCFSLFILLMKKFVRSASCNRSKRIIFFFLRESDKILFAWIHAHAVIVREFLWILSDTPHARKLNSSAQHYRHYTMPSKRWRDYDSMCRREPKVRIMNSLMISTLSSSHTIERYFPHNLDSMIEWNSEISDLNLRHALSLVCENSAIWNQRKLFDQKFIRENSTWQQQESFGLM